MKPPEQAAASASAAQDHLLQSSSEVLQRVWPGLKVADLCPLRALAAYRTDLWGWTELRLCLQMVLAPSKVPPTVSPEAEAPGTCLCHWE
jgi:hypothetical protein